MPEIKFITSFLILPKFHIPSSFSKSIHSQKGSSHRILFLKIQIDIPINYENNINQQQEILILHNYII